MKFFHSVNSVYINMNIEHYTCDCEGTLKMKITHIELR